MLSQALCFDFAAKMSEDIEPDDEVNVLSSLAGIKPDEIVLDHKSDLLFGDADVKDKVGSSAIVAVDPEQVHPQSAGTGETAEEDKKSLAEVKNEEMVALTLLHLAEQTKSEKPRRKLCKQSTDKLVEKTLRDNFRGWSAVDVDGTQKNGLTLRQKLSADKRKCRADPGSIVMGATYYADLRKQYGSAGHAVSQLKVKDESEDVNPTLIAALRAAKSTTGRKSELLAWLAVGTDCNQKELVGIARMVLEQRPLVSSAQCELVIQFMKFCVKGGHQAQEDIMRLMHKQFDLTLCARHQSYRKEGFTTNCFVDLNSDILSLVIPNTGDVKALMQAKSSWADLKPQLARVVDGAHLGAQMFGFARAHIVADEIQKTIEKHLEEWRGKPLSAAAAAKVRTKCLDEISALQGLKLLPSKRIIAIVYRGIKIKLTIQTLFEEFEFRFMAKVKEWAVRLNFIDPLVCENSLVTSPSTRDTPCSIDDELIKGPRAARAMANSFFETEGWCSGEAIKGVLEQKAPILIQIDKTFGIEIAFYEALVAEEGQRLLTEKSLACLPTERDNPGAEMVLSRLTELRNSDVFRFCPRGTQGLVETVRELIAALAGGRSPVFPLGPKTEFMQKVLAQMSFFVAAVVQDEKFKGGFHTVYGEHALKVKFDKMSAAMQEGTDFDFEALEIYHVYDWMTTDEMKEAVNSWTLTKLAALEDGMHSAEQAKAAKRSLMSGPQAIPLEDERPKKKKKKAAAQHDDVMALFGN